MKAKILRIAGTRRVWFDGGYDRFAFGFNLLPERWGLALLLIVDERFCLTQTSKAAK